MGVDTSAVDQLRQTIREMKKRGEAGFMEDMNLGRVREGTRVVALEDGTGNALAARVNADNNVGTEARFGRTSVVSGSDTADTTSQVFISERAGRLTFTLQNLDDATPVHFRMGTGSATTGDLRLDPGQSYSPPPGIAFEGPVSCVTGVGSAVCSWVEYVSGA
jgi:hypothetical protein